MGKEHSRAGLHRWISDQGLEHIQEALESGRLDQAEDAIRAESSNGFADDLFRSLQADIARVTGASDDVDEDL